MKTIKYSDCTRYPAQYSKTVPSPCANQQVVGSHILLSALDEQGGQLLLAFTGRGRHWQPPHYVVDISIHAEKMKSYNMNTWSIQHLIHSIKLACPGLQPHMWLAGLQAIVCRGLRICWPRLHILQPSLLESCMLLPSWNNGETHRHSFGEKCLSRLAAL